MILTFRVRISILLKWLFVGLLYLWVLRDERFKLRLYPINLERYDYEVMEYGGLHPGVRETIQ